MTIKIDRAKFIEQLAAIKEILVDAYKNDRMHYIVADAKSEVEDSVLFKNGMIEWSNHENECPFCGDPVYIQDSDQLGGPYEIFVCSKCHRQIPNELYEKITYVVSPDGVAEFVKRSLGCKYVHPCGDGNYRLGKLYGRAVYFCASPVEGLYNTHNENVILVVCDMASVPKGWQNDTCKVIPFTELFYMKDGAIRLADAAEELKPKEREPRFGRRRRVADRRDEWLEVLAHIFDNAYNPKAMRRLLKRNATGGVSLRPIPESALLILRTKVFMDQNYEFRKNVLTRVTQYRELSQPDFDFQDVTGEVRNSMTTKAMLAGLKSWDRDIKRYIESNDIPQYDPIEDYLSHLPAWDGTDRVTAFAQLVPTDDALWQRFYPVWMRSMVAHWLGKDRSHGNALMPLLIGPQGCGKSTFCGKVLPPELTPYYNDRVNFKNEFDLLNQLSSYALINVDEFDSIGVSRQPLLKYLLSKPDVKLRVPYGKSISNRRRYASFIATTNQQLPLTDPTGARRFLCVNVTGRIDTESPVDYAQLYAQLLAEVQSGLRYWLTDEETAEVIAHNEQFRQLDSIEEMVRSLFRKPKSGDTDAVILPVVKIVSILRERFPGVQANRATFIKVGKILVSIGCEGHRNSSGNAYQVVVQEK